MQKILLLAAHNRASLPESIRDLAPQLAAGVSLFTEKRTIAVYVKQMAGLPDAILELSKADRLLCPWEPPVV